MSITGPDRKGRAGKQDEVEDGLGQDEEVQNSHSYSGSSRQLPMEPCMEPRRDSVFPPQWRITHSSRQLAQVLASGLSLIAFILLLVMLFSKKWLCLSKSRFYQRWPTNVSKRIYTSAHLMSMGPLQICKSKSCSNSENGKDSFKLWTNHPVFLVAKITFALAVVLGFVLTIWLHLPYLPGLQRSPSFGWTGTVMSFCEVTFIFSTLMLFPINIWLFELKRNLSVPLGWSYFIGWLVFILYITCAVLCYFNHKSFWRLILSRSSGAVSSSSSSSSELSVQQFQDSVNKQIVSNTSVNQEEVLDPEQKKASL
ncbi:outer dense fiber protein 4 isoform X1 [Equus przewalskii]|uniref:Outer dense fiber protein 4 isoform X1 n=1 Tax=Equus przewalskii TaxID=9798 RepID=A0ABM2FAG0_EQUPR|nr:outer dense fiber protein 4 isoform X1 [Equus caballus]XP_008530635.1 PREDICTED: outer dense fiber protein 4 isoform X1 [Equus przewalskii]XP_014719591.1 outer dense fiber protein 4 isoform X1 [Equus asinus]